MERVVSKVPIGGKGEDEKVEKARDQRVKVIKQILAHWISMETITAGTADHLGTYRQIGVRFPILSQFAASLQTLEDKHRR